MNVKPLILNLYLRFFIIIFPLLTYAHSEIIEPSLVVPELVELGLNPQVSKIYPKMISKLRFASHRYLLNIKLGKLTQQ